MRTYNIVPQIDYLAMEDRLPIVLKLNKIYNARFMYFFTEKMYKYVYVIIIRFRVWYILFNIDGKDS